MKMFDNLDSRPSCRVVKLDTPIKVKLVDFEDKKWLKGHFDGTENYQQIEHIIPNKEYNMIAYETMGDVADITIINDIGEEYDIMECFFEEC